MHYLRVVFISVEYSRSNLIFNVELTYVISVSEEEIMGCHGYYMVNEGGRKERG